MTLTPTATIGNWDCSASTVQKLTCFYTKSITGTTLIDPLQFKVNVAPNINASVSNTASLFFNGLTRQSTIVTPISSADLILAKQEAPSPVQSIGTLITYTLTITNNGPAVATNVVVTETLPTELQPYTSTNLLAPAPNPTQGIFGVSANPNIYNWNVGNLARGQVEKLVIWTRPKATSNGKTVTNQARATSSNHDWILNNNVATTSFVVGGVEIAKSFSPNTGSLFTGDIFTFTIAITNVSASQISQINIKDTFTNTLDIVDCRIAFFSPSNSQSCSVSNRNLSTFISLASGQRANVNVRVRGNKDIGGTAFTFKNHASATWGSPSFTLNSNEVEVTIFPGGFILVGKNDRLTQVEKSQLISYTVAITNVGSLSTDQGSLVVTDTFLTNLDFFDIIKNGLVMNEIPTLGNSRTWSIPDVALAPGQVISFTIIAKVFAVPAGTSVVNQVSASARASGRSLSATGSDTNTIPITVLTIDKAVSKTTVFAGETFFYTVTIQNLSLSLINANVTDAFSGYLDITGCRLSYISPNIAATNCFVTNRTLTTFVSLQPFQTARIVIEARGNTTVGNLFKNVANTATVTWGTPTNTRISNEVDITIFPSGFLDVGKSDNNDTVFLGQSISYTISISNVGSLAISANSLRVTDTFLSNVSFTGLNTNGLTMEQVFSSGIVRAWTIKNKSLNPGEKLSFLVGARVSSSPSSTTTINKASASAKDSSDRALPQDDGFDTNDITESPVTTLRFTKSVTPQQAKVGETFTFQISVQNRGTVTLNNVRMSDVFPEQLNLTSATTSRGTAQLSTTTREVQITIPTLNGGESASIVILASVNTSVATPKTLRNRAELNWNGGVTTLSNNVSYRVLPSGSLPGTGLEAVPAQAGFVTGPSQILAGLGIILVLCGLALLVYGLWARQRRPLYADRYTRNALVVLFIAAVFGLSAWLTHPGTSGSTQMATLSGEKPPLATSLETPTAPIPPPLSTEGSDAGVTPVGPSDGITELRPTLDPRLPTQDPAQPTPTLSNGEVDISYLLPTPTPVDLPNFDIPTPMVIPSTGPNGGSPDSSAVTRLVIPKMELDTIVKYVPFSGSTWLISGLKQEIAWMGDTSWPGLGGNTALAGHVDLVTGAKGPFWNLKELKKGDEITVYTEKNLYTYRVREQTVVEDYDLSVIQPTDKPQITLITCTSWNPELHMYIKRLVIYADLANVNPLTSQSN
jgi:LPXTG-site transpeptidase (sortase) family protein